MNSKKFLESVKNIVESKCFNLSISSEVVTIELFHNMIIINVPASPQFIDYVYFNRPRRNYLDVLMDISEYIDKSLQNMFTKNRVLTEDEFAEKMNAYDLMSGNEE